MDIRARTKIIDIYSNLKYKKPLESFQKILTTSDSDNCEDFFNIGLNIDKNKITAIGFNGDGCIISTIATELSIKAIENKTINQAKKILSDLIATYKDKNSANQVVEELKLLIEMNVTEKRLQCLLLTPSNLLQWFKNF